MKQFRAINLIAFCTLLLFVDDNSATISYLLRKYIPALLNNVKGIKTLGRGIVPGNISFQLRIGEIRFPRLNLFARDI